MESKYGVREPDKVRFMIFIVFHIVLCMSVFLYARELVEFEPIADTMSDAYVDGTDVTDIVNAGIYTFNGIFTVITGGLYVLVMFVWSAVLLIPFRIIALRKTTQVTDFEVKATLVIAAVGVVLSLTAGVLFMGTGSLWMMGVLFLPVLIFEIPVYWGGLWSRKISLQSELTEK